MPEPDDLNLSSSQKKKIEQNLISIFKEIYLNGENVLRAKEESQHISEEIRNFILNYAETKKNANEVELLIDAKQKGLELVNEHNLIFYDELIGDKLRMRAFLIPGMKVDYTEENAAEKITEDDLQAVDHELCVSFKLNENNEFTKLGNLLDIRAALAKAMSVKSKGDKETVESIKSDRNFTGALKELYVSASRVFNA